MTKIATPIVLSESETDTLVAWLRAGSTEQRHAERARIILAAGEGVGTLEIARCWRHVCMGMNLPVTAVLFGDGVRMASERGWQTRAPEAIMRRTWTSRSGHGDGAAGRAVAG
jgi:hypothetical protein